MKKLLAILLAGLMLVSMMSVAAFGVDLPDISGYASDEGVTFYALLISAGTSKSGKGYVDVCGLSINDINHRGLYTASFGEDVKILNDGGEVITIDDLSQGDIVAITYSGDANDLYPGQLLDTTKVCVVDHVDTFAEIKSLIPTDYEDYGDYFSAWNDFVDNLARLDCSIGDGKVTLSWDKTDDESYTVYWKRSSSDEWKVAGTTTKHKVNITGLKNGVSYDFKVEILGEDSKVVTATPTDEVIESAKIECYKRDEYVAEYSVYETSDSGVISELKEIYESFETSTESSSRPLEYPYYKITVVIGSEEIVYHVGEYVISAPTVKNAVSADGTDYFGMISEIVAGLTQ